MKEYEIVAKKLCVKIPNADDAMSQAEELALNARSLFGHLLSPEEIFSIAFLSGVRWQIKQGKPRDGVI